MRYNNVHAGTSRERPDLLPLSPTTAATSLQGLTFAQRTEMLDKTLEGLPVKPR